MFTIEIGVWNVSLIIHQITVQRHILTPVCKGKKIIL